MSQCCLCKTELSGFSGKKIANGYICKECLKKLPKKISKLTQYEDYILQSIYNLTHNELTELFECTASYGKLHIDEMHGVFCISEKIDKEGKPYETTDVYPCIRLKEISIYCTNPKVNRNNRVVCDIELQALFFEPPVSIKTTIAKNVLCQQKRIDSDHVSWDEPGDFSMFKNIFNSMLKTTAKKFEEGYINKFVTPENIALFKAESLFMLEDGYTKEEIKKQWKKLIKTFHSDENEGDTHCSQVINDAYHILLNHVK